MEADDQSSVHHCESIKSLLESPLVDIRTNVPSLLPLGEETSLRAADPPLVNSGDS